MRPRSSPSPSLLGPAIGILLVIFAVGLRHLLASTDVDRAVVAALAALATQVGGGPWILTDGDPAGPVAGIGLIAGPAGMVFVLATSVTMLRQRATLTT